MKIITRKEALAQGLQRYYTGKPCKYGHISERNRHGMCLECLAISSRVYRENNKDKIKLRSNVNREKIAQRNASYREKNKEKIAEFQAKWRKDNKEKIAEFQARYRKNNKEKIAEYRKNNKEKITKQKAEYRKKNKEKMALYQAMYSEKNKQRKVEYRKNNKEKIAEYRKNNKEKIAEYRKNNKEKAAEYYAKYRKNNPEMLFIRRSLRRVEDNWKGGRTEAEAIHSYTFQELRQHIESQFKEGMSWDNRSEWHIDHIKPIKAFLDEGITDPAIINALSNLQPLWAYDNISKGAKYENKSNNSLTTLSNISNI